MKSFILMKVYIFEDLYILNALSQKYIANIAFKLFTKWCFTLLQFYLKNEQEKNSMIKAEDKQNIVLNKDIKKENFKKYLMN